jgi:hypothetical protein
MTAPRRRALLAALLMGGTLGAAEWARPASG